MSVTLVDTNVLLDVINKDENWHGWSARQLELAAFRGPIVVNDVIYAELSVRYAMREMLDSHLTEAGIEIAPTPRAASFLAGKAYQRYRKGGGTRTGVLPDFFIGAHASAAGWTLLTRDKRRYRTDFPAIDLIIPGDA